MLGKICKVEAEVSSLEGIGREMKAGICQFSLFQNVQTSSNSDPTSSFPREKRLGHGVYH
jgi:hypothetical protein